MVYNLKTLEAKLRHFKNFKGCLTAQINPESAADAVWSEYLLLSHMQPHRKHEAHVSLASVQQQSQV